MEPITPDGKAIHVRTWLSEPEFQIQVHDCKDEVRVFGMPKWIVTFRVCRGQLLVLAPLKNDDVPTASSQRALWKSAVKIPLAADGIVELEAIARTASKNWRPPPR